jgi:hypothetical protein
MFELVEVDRGLGRLLTCFSAWSTHLEPTLRKTIWKCDQHFYSSRSGFVRGVHSRLRGGAWNRPDYSNCYWCCTHCSSVMLDWCAGYLDRRKCAHHVLQRESPPKETQGSWYVYLAI